MRPCCCATQEFKSHTCRIEPFGCLSYSVYSPADNKNSLKSLSSPTTTYCVQTMLTTKLLNARPTDAAWTPKNNSLFQKETQPAINLLTLYVPRTSIPYRTMLFFIVPYSYGDILVLYIPIAYRIGEAPVIIVLQNWCLEGWTPCPLAESHVHRSCKSIRSLTPLATCL